LLLVICYLLKEINMNNRLQDNRKRRSGLFSSLLFAPYYLLLALVAVACTMGLIDDLDFDTVRASVSNPIPDNPLTGDILIIDYNLQAYVPVPTTGAVAVKGITSRGDMDITVRWKDSGGSDITALLGTFAPDAVYQAEISLTAKKAYGFDPRIPFAYPAGAVEACSEDLGEKARVVSVTYFAAASPVTVEAGLDLAPYLPSPVTGAGPVVNFYQGAYGGTVVWKTGGTEAAGFFQGGLVYTAVVTLYPGPGCVFPDPVPVIYNKAGVIVGAFTPVPGTNQIRGQIEFPATGAVVVDDLDLTDKIPAPVMSGTAIMDFKASQYTGTVEWDPVPSGGSFAANTEYTATVTLEAVKGYTLEGVSGFTHSGASSPLTEDSGKVTIVFQQTSNVAAVTVADTNLGNHISAPEQGEEAVTNFTGVEYTGTVEWSPALSGGRFGAGIEYAATVTLTAKSGFTFNGVAENAFSLSGSTAITNAEDSGLVSVTFPPTGSVPLVKVTDMDLTGKVYAPVMGEMPVGVFSGLQYSGSVTWFLNGTEHTGAFKYGQIYTAVVTPAVVPGYTFTGVAENAFSLSGSTAIITNAENSGMVTVTFPPVVFYPGPYISSFSGEHAKPMDSAIDVIRGTKSAYPDFLSLSLSLDPGNESVKLDLAEDLGRGGTSAMYGLDLTSADSPPYVEIDGRGRVVDLTGTQKGFLITVRNGVTLALKNITLKGLNTGDDGSDNNQALILVQTGGALVLKEGAHITGNTSTTSNAYLGGGVYVYSGGTFTMEGGTISGNTGVGGGGVSLGSSYSGTFIMKGGTIKDNTVTGTNGGGGVYVGTNGTFTMKSGTISGNTATANGGGVYAAGSFTMEGGTISGNEASSGSGVYFNSSSKTFTMKSGTISGNTATANGGGVMVANGTFTKIGGIIYGQNETGQDTNNKDLKNTAASGHAAYVTSGPKKRDNTAAEANNLDSTQSSTAGGWD
jgi:hypothetical protein